MLLMFAFIVISLLLFWIIYMVYRAHHDMIDRREIIDPNLPSPFHGWRIFFISDIHKRRINRLTLKKITQPIDVVVIGGDLTEKSVPLSRTIENLHRLAELQAPIYFVWGNNDYEIKPKEKLEQLLNEADVTILANSYRDIKRKNSVLRLYGTDYYQTNLENRKQIIKPKDLEGDYTILLSHNPYDFYQLDPTIKDKINFVLSGHTHGGQIRLFGLGMYKNGGLSTDKQTKVLVSEGYGYTLLPFRLQTKAECHVVTLKKS